MPVPSVSARRCDCRQIGRRSLLLLEQVAVDGEQANTIRLTGIVSIDISRSMSVDLLLSPKTKRPAGVPCCEPVVYPDVEREQATRMATIAKALGDPVRVQLV